MNRLQDAFLCGIGCAVGTCVSIAAAWHGFTSPDPTDDIWSMASAVMVVLGTVAGICTYISLGKRG